MVLTLLKPPHPKRGYRYGSELYRSCLGGVLIQLMP